MKRNLLFLLMLSVSVSLSAQKTVSQDVMRKVYDEVRTPYKYGLAVVPPDEGKMVDSPTVFRHGKRWYMTYVLYDGRGYETWLAESENLLDWQTLGRILSFGYKEWDSSQRAGYLGLQDYKWGGSYAAGRYDGKCWMSYIGGSARGYEAGHLSIGMAYTDGDVSKAHEWDRLEAPVLRPDSTITGKWDAYTLYKSSVIKDRKKHLGAPFVMFYNAKGTSTGFENIGVAVSDDMRSWRRYGLHPVLEHPGCGITGDAQIQRMGNLYVMFYFGAFWPGRTEQAFDSFACSYDLEHWTDWTGESLVAPSEPYDSLFAHKPFVLKYKGVVYHFYCAVDEHNHRGIAVATSRDMGKSRLTF